MSDIQFYHLRNGCYRLDCLKAQPVSSMHAGHGLCFETVKPIAAIPQVIELNIGHFLVGEAIFVGLDAAIAKMSGLMDEARGGAAS